MAQTSVQARLEEQKRAEARRKLIDTLQLGKNIDSTFFGGAGMDSIKNSFGNVVNPIKSAMGNIFGGFGPAGSPGSISGALGFGGSMAGYGGFTGAGAGAGAGIIGGSTIAGAAPGYALGASATPIGIIGGGGAIGGFGAAIAPVLAPLALAALLGKFGPHAPHQTYNTGFNVSKGTINAGGGKNEMPGQADWAKWASQDLMSSLQEYAKSNSLTIPDNFKFGLRTDTQAGNENQVTGTINGYDVTSIAGKGASNNDKFMISDYAAFKDKFLRVATSQFENQNLFKIAAQDNRPAPGNNSGSGGLNLSRLGQPGGGPAGGGHSVMGMPGYNPNYAAYASSPYAPAGGNWANVGRTNLDITNQGNQAAFGRALRGVIDSSKISDRDPNFGDFSMPRIPSPGFPKTRVSPGAISSIFGGKIGDQDPNFGDGSSPVGATTPQGATAPQQNYTQDQIDQLRMASNRANARDGRPNNFDTLGFEVGGAI
jgi:hypothetical protein